MADGVCCAYANLTTRIDEIDQDGSVARRAEHCVHGRRWHAASTNKSSAARGRRAGMRVVIVASAELRDDGSLRGNESHQAIPRKTASKRLTSIISRALAAPNGAPILSWRSVMALSIMIWDVLPNPLCESGLTVTRSNGASIRVLEINKTVLVETIRLNDQRRSWFSKVAGCDHGHKGSALHVVPRKTSSSAPSMKRCSSVSCRSAFAARRDWRLHSATKRRLRVSGTQI